MVRALAFVLHLVLARPFLRWFLRPRVRGREHLPSCGPAVLAANHNSHLDTLALMGLFPVRTVVACVRPVAASDYFLRNRALQWFATRIVHIIPVVRDRSTTAEHDPLAECSNALDAGDILIFFPEGTRGEPEHLGEFRTGLGHLMRAHPRVPVIPVFLSGFGRALPRGKVVPRPHACHVRVGEPLWFAGDPYELTQRLREGISSLQVQYEAGRDVRSANRVRHDGEKRR